MKRFALLRSGPKARKVAEYIRRLALAVHETFEAHPWLLPTLVALDILSDWLWLAGH